MTPGTILYRLADAPLYSGDAPAYHVEEWRVERISKRGMVMFLRQVVHGQVSQNDREKAAFIGARRPFAHLTQAGAAQAYARRKFRQIEHTRRALTLTRARFGAVKAAYAIDMAEPDDAWFSVEHIIASEGF